MTSGLSNQQLEPDLGYGKLLAILLRRWFWVLSVMLGVISFAIFKTLTTAPTYESRMQLLVEPNYPARSTLEGEQESQTSEQDYATQLNLMRSSQFVEQVLELLQSEYPDLAIVQLEKNLTLSQLQEGDINTRIFEAVYTAGDALKTQKVLETLQQVYQDYSRQQDEQRLNQGLAFLNEGLPVAQKELLGAEGALKQFREKENLINPEEQAQAVTEALNALERQRLETQSQYRSAQSRYQAIRQQLSLGSEEALIASRLSESARYQELLNQLQQTELTLAEKRTVFTDLEPEVQQLLEQRQSLLALLRQEIERVLGGVPAQLQVTPASLLKIGQLSTTDLSLAQRLVEVEAEIDALQTREQSLSANIEELQAELNQFPNLISQYNQLQPEVDTQRLVIEQLLTQQQELSLELVRGGFTWQLVEPPQLGKQVAPSLKTNIALGIVGGLFLGGIAAFLRDALDDRVHTSDELKQQVAFPLLGIIPELPKLRPSPLPRLGSGQADEVPAIFQSMYWPPFREAIDLIYKNIRLVSSTTKLNSLLVTSALPKEGKSTLIIGLAFSAARLHQRVLLIDANLRNASLHRQLNLDNHQGLSTVLQGEEEVSYSMKQISLLGSTIDILTAGPVPDDPVQLLSSQRMRQLMARFEEQYDLILLDTASVLGTVDVLETASFSHGLVMVERIDRVTQSDLTQAIAMLNQFNVIGIVANGSNHKGTPSMTLADQNGAAKSRHNQPVLTRWGRNE
ncbi:MAG: GumC family protein [Microcoleaceae cyanobacterium]